MICKSLICFCSRTPGGRVDVVERMIGHIFVDMWAFWRGVRSPPSLVCFLLLLLLPCYLLALLSCLFFFLLHNIDKKKNWKVDFLTRICDKKTRRRRRRYTFQPTIVNKKEANDSLPKGILPQYGDPRGG